MQIFPETVRLLAELQPLGCEPTTSVFTTIEGEPFEPKAFASRHWYACLRAQQITPVRGIYATKDTYVTTCLRVGKSPVWIETQTGVSWATLKRHYANWMPANAELDVFATEDPGLFDQACASEAQGLRRTWPQLTDIAADQECEEGDLNPHGCYPTSPSN